MDEENKTFYLHSATTTFEPAKPNAIYSVLSQSVFSILLIIYSEKPNEDYTVHLSMTDLNNFTPSSEIIRKYKNIDCEEYHYFMKSIFVVFEPFKRFVLNNKEYPFDSLKDLYSYVENWMVEELKNKKNGNYT